MQTNLTKRFFDDFGNNRFGKNWGTCMSLTSCFGENSVTHFLCSVLCTHKRQKKHPSPIAIGSWAFLLPKRCKNCNDEYVPKIDFSKNITAWAGMSQKVCTVYHSGFFPSYLDTGKVENRSGFLYRVTEHLFRGLTSRATHQDEILLHSVTNSGIQ